MTDLAHKDSRVVAITAAMPGGTKLEIFKNELPDRYFDVGIAEEHAALFSCGLAAEGYRPFLAIYSTFMQRAYDTERSGGAAVIEAAGTDDLSDAPAMTR